MKAMFQNCNKVNSLDLTYFDTSKVTDMEKMFSGCNKLEKIKGINNFNTINVTNMKEMFYECKKLVFLDISNFNIDNVNDLEGMFNKCPKLKKITFNDKNKEKFNQYGISSDGKEIECLILSKKNDAVILNKNQKEILKQLSEQLNEGREKNRKLISEIESMFAIRFVTSDQNIDYPLVCKKTDIFKDIEEKLYLEVPELKNYENVFFTANGQVIIEENTLEENNIKKGNYILINYN